MADDLPHVHHHAPLFSPAVTKIALVAAFATGVVLFGSVLFDLHSHTCRTCGVKWRHLGAFNGGDARAHTCATCGSEQWWKDGR